MANRNTLSVIKLDDFKAWLVSDSWQIQVPRGFYEVLRATKEGRKHPLIVYWQHDTNGGKTCALHRSRQRYGRCESVFEKEIHGG